MKILAIETSCDETSVAVVVNGEIKSNVVWSQIKLHAPWGGVVPSVAKRAHEERIDQVAEQAMVRGGVKRADFVAVTIGPGLAIALEVGILKAKELCKKWGAPLIKVNHLEGHLLSSLAGRDKIAQSEQTPARLSSDERFSTSDEKFFPALGLVVSGGHTELVYMEKIGEYKILAKTADDALGEALDKAAKMMELPYPGGPVIEQLARLGQAESFKLPIPLRGRESEGRFSYSGLKTALLRLVEKEKLKGKLGEKTIQNLAASYQKTCFDHLIRVVRANALPCLTDRAPSSPRLRRGEVKSLLVGGGVIFNKYLRERLKELGKELGVKVYFPKEGILCGDNAGMIGLAGYHKALRGEVVEEKDFDKVDRLPRWSLDQKD